MKLLHIAAHLGGGAGKAIVELSKLCLQIRPHLQISIMIFEQPLDFRWIKRAETFAIKLWICPTENEAKDIIKDQDIVVFDWWAHPTMYKILNVIEDIPVRAILWTHYAGVRYPQLSAEFINKFDYWFSTCEYSYENPNWSKKDLYELKQKSSIVYGIGEFLPKEFLCKRDYSIKGEIKIAYLGTVDYSKMNIEYFRACKAIVEKVPNACFYIYGKPSKEIYFEISKFGLDDFVFLRGYNENIENVLVQSDIFGYPLNPLTSGTTENSILEAMAIGLPIVVLNQGTEKHIINHGITGMCVNDMNEYVDTIIELCEDQNKREKLGKRAREEVIKSYDAIDNAKKFIHVVERMIKSIKEKIKWSDVIGIRPIDYFWQSLGNTNIICKENKELFFEILINSTNKGSLKHFMKVYPDDRLLAELYNKIIKGFNL